MRIPSYGLATALLRLALPAAVAARTRALVGAKIIAVDGESFECASHLVGTMFDDRRISDGKRLP